MIPQPDDDADDDGLAGWLLDLEEDQPGEPDLSSFRPVKFVPGVGLVFVEETCSEDC